MHRIITNVQPKDRLTILATFADGEVVSFDVKTMFEKHPVFRLLENEDLFRGVKVDGVGYGLAVCKKPMLSCPVSIQ